MWKDVEGWSKSWGEAGFCCWLKKRQQQRAIVGYMYGQERVLRGQGVKAGADCGVWEWESEAYLSQELVQGGVR